MFSIWWSAYIVPVLMVLAGFIGSRLPANRYRSPYGKLSQEQQEFADCQLFHMLRQFGFVFAALAFMVMRSVRLIPLEIQRWLVYGFILLEIVSIVLMVIPVERAIRAQFNNDTENTEGDSNED